MITSPVLASIRFTGWMNPWLFAVIAILAAMGLGWYYLRETRHLAAPYSYLLPALRTAAIVLTLFILTGPVWHDETVVGQLGRVIFAVDTSASMSVQDSQAGDSPNRLGRSLELLTGGQDARSLNESAQNAGQRLSGNSASDPDLAATNFDANSGGGLIAKLLGTHHVDVIAFDQGTPRRLWSTTSAGDAGDDQAATLDGLRALGAATDLESVLTVPNLAPADPTGRETSTRAATTNDRSGGKGPESQPGNSDDTGGIPTAIVLLTDGRDNVRSRAASLNASGRLAVHAIGVGSNDEPTDAGIISVTTPDNVAFDGQLRGDIRLKRFGSDRRFSVRIETADGRIVWEKDKLENTNEAIPFEIDVSKWLQREDTRGGAVRRATEVLDLVAITSMDGDDAVPQNDRLAFRVAASTRDRRLLILDGSSRWETRYLRNLFDRDPTWQVDTIVFGPGTDTPVLKFGEAPGTFPASDTAISRYDAVILGEVPPNQLDGVALSRLAGFVRRGGGLVVIDGQYDRVRNLNDSVWRELMPVKIVPGTQREIKSITPAVSTQDHPMFDLRPGDDPIGPLWSQLPAPNRATKVEVLPGAETWAHLELPEDERSPWIVSRRYGSGRVFYFSSDQTWRWRYKVADEFHARFWNQVLYSVMQPPFAASDDFVSIATDSIQYASGQTATIRVRLRGGDGQAVGDAVVDGLLFRDGQLAATIPLSVDDPSRGTYRGISPPLASGAYEVRAHAGGFDTRALRASTPIWVGDTDLREWNQMSVDANGLRQWTQARGGIYVHESAADEILEQLRPLSTGTLVRTDYTLWQSWYMFLPIIGLLTVEWYLRKRASLI